MESTLHCLDLAPSPADALAEPNRSALPQRPDPPGRSPASETLEALLEATRGVRVGALVVRGEPGLGKTTLVEHAVQTASGFRCRPMIGGVEAERDLSFAGLHRLCAPMMDRVDRAPGSAA